MRTDLRKILRNIQAAARIGHVESLWAALDQLQDIPQIGGNHPMNEKILNQVILPVGKSVSKTRINRAALRPLITHPYAAYRAVAGVALVTRFLNGENNTTLKDLNGLVQDPRNDVRLAIQTAAVQTNDPNPEKIEALYDTWQKSNATRIQTLAYQILPHLPEEITLKKINAFRENLYTHPPEVRKTLAKSLAHLVANGHASEVLEILTYWSTQDQPDFGLVARSLSRPWAAHFPDQALEILTKLAANAGAKRRIRKALENLYNRGAEEQVKSVLESWRNSENPNLRAAGNDKNLNF
jgi:hypothetical protein